MVAFKRSNPICLWYNCTKYLNTATHTIPYMCLCHFKVKSCTCTSHWMYTTQTLTHMACYVQYKSLTIYIYIHCHEMANLRDKFVDTWVHYALCLLTIHWRAKSRVMSLPWIQEFCLLPCSPAQCKFSYIYSQKTLRSISNFSPHATAFCSKITQFQ